MSEQQVNLTLQGLIQACKQDWDKYVAGEPGYDFGDDGWGNDVTAIGEIGRMNTPGDVSGRLLVALSEPMLARATQAKSSNQVHELLGSAIEDALHDELLRYAREHPKSVASVEDEEEGEAQG